MISTEISVGIYIVPIYFLFISTFAFLTEEHTLKQQWSSISKNHRSYFTTGPAIRLLNLYTL